MMRHSRSIQSRLTSISLGFCLALPALPALSQTAETALPTAPTATQVVPQTVPDAVQSAELPATPDTSPPLWATPADLIEHKPATISPARAGEADILSCPFETLRAAYLSLYNDTDALNVAALESEVFKVCIERQKQVKQLLNNEERLRTQLGDAVRPATIAQNQSIAARVIAARVIAPPSEAKITEDGQDALDAATTITPPPPETFRETKSAALNQSTLPQCADRYTSGPVFGATTLDGGLHAFVFDALSDTHLTVKAGDTLPGGLTIQRISIEDGVIVSEQGIEHKLARTLTEPAFDDGGGLLFKTVSMADVYKIDSAGNGSQDSNWEALE